MVKFLLLVVCLLAGFILRKTRFFDEKSPIVLNNLLVYFFIPVLTLYHVPTIAFNIDQIWLSITPFIVYLCSFLFIKANATIFSFDRPTEGALIMCSGIGSISFVGFPIFELLYGSEGLSYGIILSLAGTFLVFNTVGISTGFYYADSKGQSLLFFVQKMLRFPPFIAFFLASIMNFLQLQYPPLINETLKALTAPFAVLALLAIGMQMEFSLEKSWIRYLLLGQFYKLILAPLMVYLLVWHVLGLRDVVGRVCILGAGIGSMNAISIVAAQLGLNPKLATLMPAIGIPVSIPLLFLIDKLLV